MDSIEVELLSMKLLLKIILMFFFLFIRTLVEVDSNLNEFGVIFTIIFMFSCSAVREFRNLKYLETEYSG